MRSMSSALLLLLMLAIVQVNPYVVEKYRIVGETCEEKCAENGHCCVGDTSADQRPSCAMGCLIAEKSPTLESCNKTCTAAQQKCTFKVDRNLTLQMCYDCPQRWEPPGTGKPGYWPPGFQLPSCSSGDPSECFLGCQFAFDPSKRPVAPTLAPTPAPRPLPPIPKGQRLNFSSTLGSHCVLQQSPARPAVYGFYDVFAAEADASIRVVVSGERIKYSINASASKGKWKAVLKPGVAGDIVSIQVSMGDETAQLDDVIFGDVYYCAGQSNMWLPLKFTYHHNESFRDIASGKYSNIRMAAGDSQVMTTNAVWNTAAGALQNGSLADFSAACYYFGESLTDLMADKAIPIGLIDTAIGGSMIEEWVTDEVAGTCLLDDHQLHNAILYDNNVRPYLDMTVKGWLWLVVLSQFFHYF